MDMLDLDRDYGHFRSHSLQSIPSEVDSVAELTSANMVRNAVMIKFLRQCQLKKLWSDISLDEGVILKRSKGDFICQPEDMSFQPGGFYDQVMRLNVKASHFSFGLTGQLTPSGIHDHENFCYSDFPPIVESSVCPIG
jgi:hypothetical protein